MTVIPFDYGRRKSTEPGEAVPEGADAPPGVLDDGDPGIARATLEQPPASLNAARLRIDTLERALITALRENATNWARAEHAERQLAALGHGPVAENKG